MPSLTFERAAPASLSTAGSDAPAVRPVSEIGPVADGASPASCAVAGVVSKSRLAAIKEKKERLPNIRHVPYYLNLSSEIILVTVLVGAGICQLERKNTPASPAQNKMIKIIPNGFIDASF
jgi:hypothetical protein